PGVLPLHHGIRKLADETVTTRYVILAVAEGKDGSVYALGPGAVHAAGGIAEPTPLMRTREGERMPPVPACRALLTRREQTQRWRAQRAPARTRSTRTASRTAGAHGLNLPGGSVCSATVASSSLWWDCSWPIRHSGSRCSRRGGSSLRWQSSRSCWSGTSA